MPHVGQSTAAYPHGFRCSSDPLRTIMFTINGIILKGVQYVLSVLCFFRFYEKGVYGSFFFKLACM